MSAGYVASARIGHGRPRLIAAPVAIPARPLDRWPPFQAPAIEDECVIDAVRPEPHGLELRVEAFRERWSQLWFFVLDSESWR